MATVVTFFVFVDNFIHQKQRFFPPRTLISGVSAPASLIDFHHESENRELLQIFEEVL